MFNDLVVCLSLAHSIDEVGRVGVHLGMVSEAIEELIEMENAIHHIEKMARFDVRGTKYVAQMHEE